MSHSESIAGSYPESEFSSSSFLFGFRGALSNIKSQGIQRRDVGIVKVIGHCSKEIGSKEEEWVESKREGRWG
jgi:hypothetical protein